MGRSRRPAGAADQTPTRDSLSGAVEPLDPDY
jgi:hypothetical protein